MKLCCTRRFRAQIAVLAVPGLLCGQGVAPFVPPPPPAEIPLTTLKPVEIIEKPKEPEKPVSAPKPAPKPQTRKPAPKPKEPETPPAVEISPPVPDLAPSAGFIEGENLGEVVIIADKPRASARTASVSDLAIQPVETLRGPELQRRAQGTLGETLAFVPGVSSNYFSPGASRPVIRGFDGFRVRTMRDGLSTMDLSDTSPDHGIPVEPVLADEIEVHRGPAALLYGSGAIGGAVDVHTRTIARELPAHAITGALDSRYETASQGWTEAGWLALTEGPFVLQFTGSLRESEDIHIPKSARTPIYDALENPRTRNPATGITSAVPNPSGRLPNSFHQSESYSAGLSWLPRDTPLWAAFSFSSYESRYGLPYFFDGDVNDFFGDGLIDLMQERYDLHLGADFEQGFIKAVQFNLASSQYAHDEQVLGRQKDLGRDISETFLTKDMIEGRLNVYHGGFGDHLDGVVGLHGYREDFTASRLLTISPQRRVGSQFQTSNLGVYALEKLTLGPWLLQLGGRWEEQTILNESVPGRITGLSESAHSLSAAITWEKKDWLGMRRFALTAIAAQNQRLPTSTERYAFWNNAALGRFIIGGDMDGTPLRLEQSTSIEAVLDAEWERAAVHLSAFHYDYENFIFLQELRRNIPRTANYIERAATFTGWEAQIDLHLLKREHQRVTVKLLGDYVRGWNETDREFIPRMPPMRLGARVEAELGRFNGGIELRHAFDQNRVRTGLRPELATEAYTLLNADLTCQLHKSERYEVSLTFQGTNLLDADARQATSFRKDVAPMPGRGFSVGMQVRF